MLTRKQINQKIRGAFLPFRCDVQFADYDAKLHFKVFDHSRNGIVEMSSIPVRQVQDERSLWDILSHVRQVVEDKGYALKRDLCLS